MENRPISAIEAQMQVIQAIEFFQTLTGQNKQMNAIIDNVDFTEIIALYKMMRTPDKMLVVPGEYGEDFFTLIYWPIPNARIVITSTPAKKLVPKINLINYN